MKMNIKKKVFTHFDSKGKAIMVDVSTKKKTVRTAKASCILSMQKETFFLIKDGSTSKGDVFGIARVAGIMAAKKTHELIPLCHPLSISAITIDFELDDKNFSIKVKSQCKLDDKTGLEMEALIAVSIAALTIYDMCKAVDKNIIISDVKLLEKSGGKSGKFKRK